MENELNKSTDDGQQTTGNEHLKYDKSDMRSHPDYEKIKNIKLRQRTWEEQQAMCNPQDILTTKAANAWIQQSSERPVPNMLFGEFWAEGEICILFADTNVGKSILAVQIADSISKGEPITGFKMEGKKQAVLYVDFELTDKQFEKRYSNNFTGHYHFDEQFMRVSINPEGSVEDGRSFEEQLRISLERSIISTQSRVVIIDNITYMTDESRKASNALNLVKQLQALKNKYNLSVLVIAHTAKRNLRKPITRNDVQGGKIMMQHCNSAFCIGESNGEKDLRYLKQVKSSGELVYASENVAVCQVAKPGNFLKLEFLYQGMEWELLKGLRSEARKEMIAFIQKRHAEGKKQRQIAAELGISVGTVNKYLK